MRIYINYKEVIGDKLKYKYRDLKPSKLKHSFYKIWAWEDKLTQVITKFIYQKWVSNRVKLNIITLY